MAEYDTLLPEVLPEAPGVSDPLAIREIRRATIELCETAMFVKQTVTDVAVLADVPTVAITLPTNKALIHLQNVSIDGMPLNPASADFLDLVWRDENQQRALFSHYHYNGYNPSPTDWRTHVQDRPEVYHLEVDEAGLRIRLVGIPRLSFSTLAYRLVLKPSRDSTGFDTWVLDDYFETIAAGALSRLLSIPNKPWTDLTLAAMNRARFDEGAGKAKGEGARDFVRDDASTGRTTAYV